MKNALPLPEVLILGDTPFPDGSAASNILRGHARAILSAGFSVGLLADQMVGREQDRLSEGDWVYRGISYWPVKRIHRRPQVHRLLNTLLAWRDDRLDWLDKQASLAGVKALLFYPGTARTVPLLLRLRRLCRLENIRLFVFVVEWHEPGRYGVRRFALRTLDGEVQRRWVNPRLSGVVCISEYLASYYRSRGVRTALIPPLLDLSDTQWNVPGAQIARSQDGQIRVLFSGSPGRERHDILLRATREARCLGINVVLEYLGCTREAIAAMPDVGHTLLDQIGDGVRFHGRVPSAEVAELTARASFGLLCRDASNWSSACFPSKVPEFLALGVPMICNLTSDLKRYLKDGDNALLVPELSVGCVTSVFRRAAALSGEALQGMRIRAKATSLKFDGRTYGQTYRELLLSGP